MIVKIRMITDMLYYRRIVISRTINLKDFIFLIIMNI